MDKNVLREVVRKHGLFIVLFVLYLFWLLPGVFPLYSYEGDALSIAWGCEHALRTGEPYWELDSYGYWMQPLIYHLICFVARVMPWASCEAIYSGLTAAFAIATICLILAFAHKLSGIGLTKLLIALYLFPEAAALAFYPNSAVFVLVFFIVGLLLTLYRRVWAACVLFCIAPLFRLDILYMYPLIVLLNVYVFGLCRKSVVVSLADALLVGAVTFIGYYLLHADILYTLSEFDRWSDVITLRQNLIAILGFYTLLNFLLVPTGLCLLYRSGKRYLFWLIVTGIVIVHFINRDFGNASKHYCYLLPLYVVAVGAVMDWLWSIHNTRRWLTVGAATLIILFNVISVSMCPNSNWPIDYISLKKHRFVKDAFNLQVLGLDFEIGLGGGRDVVTADEIILLTGNLFYPGFIHNVKEDDCRNADAADKFVENLDDDEKICLIGWENSQRLFISYLNRLPVANPWNEMIDLSVEKPLSDKDLSFMKANLRDALSAGAAQYPDKKLYVCSPATICFRYTYLLDLLAREGVLLKVGKQIYLYQR